VWQATGPVFHHKTRIRNHHDQSQNLQIENLDEDLKSKTKLTIKSTPH